MARAVLQTIVFHQTNLSFFIATPEFVSLDRGVNAHPLSYNWPWKNSLLFESKLVDERVPIFYSLHLQLSLREVTDL